MLRRAVLVLVLAATVALAIAPGAGAQADTKPGRNQVVLTGRAQVRPGETMDTVFIADGPVVIGGTVRKSVVDLNGDVLVQGTVRKDVVALDGRVVVASTGHVGGDVISRHRPIVQRGGRVDGSWQRWNAAAWGRGLGIASRIAVWIAFTVSTLALGLLLGLLAPRAATAVDRALGDNAGAVVGWGLILTIGLPIAAGIVLITIVGLPLGLGVLLALGLIYGIGYTTGAWLLGRRVARGSRPIVAFLAGWAILRVIALIPVIGLLSWLAAVVVGLGAIAVAGWRARTRPVTAQPEAQVVG